MTSRRALDPSEIYIHALAMIAEDGLDALTLRPFANRLGIGLSSLTYRFESKEALLTFLIGMARQGEEETLSQWNTRLQPLCRIAPDALAEIIDEILSELVTQHRHRTLLFCELIQLCGPLPELWPLAEPWIESRLTFWTKLADRVYPKPDYPLGQMLHAYVTDELVHALALEALPAYRRLRRLGLKQLCEGLHKSTEIDTGVQGPLVLAGHCIEQLGNLPGDMAVDHQAPAPKGKSAEWVRHIADLIVDKGAGAVTHRAVAAKAKIASSTLAYHFKTQDDLLRAGLEDIIRRLTRDVQIALSGSIVDSPNPKAAVEISRSTYTIALWATRRPTLLACAADMRRLRGINLHKILRTRLEGLDLLSAQAMSITGIGTLMLNGYRGTEHAIEANYRTIETLAQVFNQKPSQNNGT